MRSRPAKAEDADFLNRCAAESGYPYPDLSDPLIEAVEIVVDSEGMPIMASAVKRLIETYLYVSRDHSPAVQIEALGMLHESLAQRMRDLGYSSAEAFLPPSIFKRFGRRLMKSFGWKENWRSFSKQF